MLPTPCHHLQGHHPRGQPTTVPHHRPSFGPAGFGRQGTGNDELGLEARD